MEQKSTEWFAARKGRVTASIVGAILGVAPYMTRAEAMRRMVRDAHGAESEFTGNIATEYGTRNEAWALTEYMMETGNAVEAVGFITRDDWAGCSPDGLIGEEGGLEIKCPFGLRKDKTPAFKSIFDQPHYFDQVQFSIWVTNRSWWNFYQWSPNGTSMEKVMWSGSWQDQNLPKLRQFYAEYLAELENPDEHLAAKRVEIDTVEAARMVAEWDQLAEAIERAEERKKDLLADMVRIAGDRNAVFAGRKLTKTERAGSVSYAKALAKYAPSADLEPFRGKGSSFWGLK
jgi:putative phage-type endonuclease